MAEHNPYAVPRAPLADESPPGNVFAEGSEVEYGGFWRRVGAQILDALILAPLGLMAYFGMQFSPKFYAYYVIPGIVVGLFYSVYLVKRFGGTPGKRILDMRIVMLDGSPITGSAAFWRYSVWLAVSTIPVVGAAIASLNIPLEGYESSGFLERAQLLDANTPGWAQIGTKAMYGWAIVAAIVMLSNQRRRATHDYIARTLVVRD